MKVTDDLYIIKLPLNFGGAVREMNVTLLADPEKGLTLFDTGLPGQEDMIESAIRAEGLDTSDLKQIVLTHQDLDHVGSLNALKERTGATVYAHETEIPYIEGDLPMVKMPSPERLAAMPELAEVMTKFKTTKVDEPLTDGQVLDIAGGVRVVPTPGHTPGHVSFYLEKSKILIAGDAIVSENGKLDGPMASATPDLASAKESVKRLSEIDIDTIVCYHGGLVTEDANDQLARVAAEA
jgi:glyoxylase-like metal-dependent hydrolase (beta-lactamase superfamily II)